MGAMLPIGGVFILINKQARADPIWLGIAVTRLMPLIYAAMPAAAAKPSEINRAVNFIADTLLFAGVSFFWHRQ